MNNPFKPGTIEYLQWLRGYQQPWTAPADNAPAAQWLGYHAAYNTTPYKG
jgi:hypothetical protein